MADLDSSLEMFRGTRVLVVDDEAVIRELLGVIIEDEFESFTAKIVANGPAALKAFMEETFDLVITDIMMPEMDGVELMGRIRAISPETPVIVFTGFATLESAQAAIRLGAYDYVLKPFSLSEIKLAVSNALRFRGDQAELRRLKKELSLLEQEKKALQRALEEASSGTSSSRDRSNVADICAAIAHSLRGEFVHIGAAVRSIGRDSSVSQEAREDCELITRSVGHAKLLLRRLLDSLEVGQPPMDAVSVLDVVRQVEELVLPRLGSDITLAIKPKGDSASVRVNVNGEQLMLVLHELIRNAGDVLREDGGTIEVGIAAGQDDVEIVIKDDGPGMSRALRARVLKEPVRSSGKGLGMGLYLANRIIESFNGKMTIRSGPKHGTRVSVRLPRAKSD